MPAPDAGGTYRVLYPAEPARTLILAPEPDGPGHRFVIAAWAGERLPEVVTGPRIESLEEGDAPGRFRLTCREGCFDFAARGIEVLEDRPALFDESLAPFALRPRDRSVVRWLLGLLRLPGGAWLLRLWHSRRR